jgi:catechol 2,3-dioxygenase-like lactoylglutathione lyase family enzyme
MPITKMEHFLVLTDDIETTRDFYCKVLGVVAGPRPPLNFGGYWLYVRDIPCVHIGDWDTYTANAKQHGIPVSTRAKGTGSMDHIAFNADDFDEIAARLQKDGIPSALNVVPENGLRQLFLEDPNGLRIEINIPARK